MSWLTIIHDISEIIGALATAALAYLVYSYTRKREIFEATSQIQNEWQVANQIILGDPELLSFEAELHPLGKISQSEAKRMYWTFLMMNVAFNSWAGRIDHLDKNLADSTINNTINRLYLDRDFVRKNVFPRGYPISFTKMIESKWTEIERTGGILPMA